MAPLLGLLPTLILVFMYLFRIEDKLDRLLKHFDLDGEDGDEE